VAIVSLPEETPVNETAALERELREEIGVSVDRVYMNALYPERFSYGEAERLEGERPQASGAVREALRAAVSEHRRASSQRAQLERLRRQVSTPVKNLPFIFEPQLGVEDARELAASLD
jgi:hypothetical protein